MSIFGTSRRDRLEVIGGLLQEQNSLLRELVLAVTMRKALTPTASPFRTPGPKQTPRTDKDVLVVDRRMLVEEQRKIQEKTDAPWRESLPQNPT